MKTLKVVFILTLLLNSLAILSAPAFAIDVNAFGHLYLEQTVSGGEFSATSCGFDLYLTNFTINTEIAITPAGTGWFLGGKLFITGWDSEVRPYFSLEYGTSGIAVQEGSGNRILETGEILSIGLEWSPWIALFKKLEAGELPASVSALQLFTYHIEVSYPIYQASSGLEEEVTAPSPRISLGIGVCFG